jgi:GTP pyrophosphokinase
VNGKLVPLRYRLRNGDTVEIITTASQTPSKDWLKFVKSSRAKQKIRNWIKYQQRARSVALGGELLERDLARHSLSLGSLRKEGRLNQLLQALSIKDEDSLLAAVGYGRLTTRQVLARLLPPQELDRSPAKPDGPLRKLFRLVGRERNGGVKVSGEGDMMVRFGRCCDPLPGERILGFITRGRGVTVHAVDCAHVLQTDPQRRVEVAWENGANAPRSVPVEVVCVDEPGLLAGITKAISSVGVNISRAQVRSMPDKRAVNSFDLMVSSAEQLNRVMRAIGKVRGVMRVARARG